MCGVGNDTPLLKPPGVINSLPINSKLLGDLQKSVWSPTNFFPLEPLILAVSASQELRSCSYPLILP